MTKPDFNILFTSAGRRVVLLRHFRRALDSLGLPGRLVTADLRRSAPAPFLADDRELVPQVSDPGYVDALKTVCVKHRIGMVVPLIDTELHILAPHRREFEALGATLLVSSPETTEICLDKRRTWEFFFRASIPTPAILDPVQLLGDPQAHFPVFLKPAAGSGSQGAVRIDDARELAYYLETAADPIVQEFAEGDEYTLDILVDFRGNVRCVVPRLRLETRAGEVSKGMTVKDPMLLAAGVRVGEALPGARGCITAQCFRNGRGEISFIEINPRFGGGFPLAAEAGADFPRWLIEMALGRDPQIALDGWRDGVVMLRYDDAVFTRRELIA